MGSSTSMAVVISNLMKAMSCLLVRKLKAFNSQETDLKHGSSTLMKMPPFMDHHPLRLEMGKVSYDVGASIEQVGEELQLFGVQLEGSGSNILLQGAGLQEVQVKFSQIQNGHTGLQLEGTGDPGGSAFSILNTDFSGLANSLLINNVANVTMGSCSFDGASSGTEAILASNIDHFQCNTSHFFDYLDHSAIWLVDVSLFRMGGGLIENAGTGIHAPCQEDQPNKTNVLLSNGATIQNCNKGIHIAKGGVDPFGNDYGLVSMKCSKLINNGVGISGIDVLLDLDACTEADPECENLQSNQFIRGTEGEDYFDIVYVDRSDIEEVHARHNYWSPLPNDSDNAYGNYRLRKAPSALYCTLNSPANKKIDLVIDAYLNEAPMSCGSELPDSYPEVEIDAFSGTPYECGILTEDGQYLLHHQYRAAAWHLRHEEWSVARDQYQAIAAIPNPTRAAADQGCRNYIDVARVMAHALSTNAAGEYGGDWEEGAFIPQSVDDRSFQVWPNPAESEVRVWFGADSYRLVVFDVLGKELFSDWVSDGAAFDVSDWESGIYLLRVEDPESGEIGVGKLMMK